MKRRRPSAGVVSKAVEDVEKRGRSVVNQSPQVSQLGPFDLVSNLHTVSVSQEHVGGGSSSCSGEPVPRECRPEYVVVRGD